MSETIFGWVAGTVITLPLANHELDAEDTALYEGTDLATDNTSGGLADFFCNECSTEVSIQDVQRIILEIETTAPTCPHCGHINQIHGFSTAYAFTCRHCGRGVSTDPLD